MRLLLLSTYELGHQPFGLASPAAFLREGGFEVFLQDLSREDLREDLVRCAELIAIYLPMHTATRLAVPLIETLRTLNPDGHLCCFGLYAPMNEAYLRNLGVNTILGGEFEAGLVRLARDLGETQGDLNVLQRQPVISLERLDFRLPCRDGLPPLSKYARLIRREGSRGIAGYTESSRGCKHLCRHCPIVPVYLGNFRIVSREVVLRDIENQVEKGAEHITFGDPDFFNGIGHAVPLVEALHREFPAITYDATIKVEHLLRHANFLPLLRDTGCLFVTSAVESVDDALLARFAKGHTRADFLNVAARFRDLKMTLQPTFVAFTPWTTPESYVELLDVIEGEGLVENVAPIQLAIRLLIPRGSLLLDLPEIATLVQPFDESALVYPWRNPDPRVDALAGELQQIIHASETTKVSRTDIFRRVRAAVCEAAGLVDVAMPVLASRATVPYLNEPWYC